MAVFSNEKAPPRRGFFSSNQEPDQSTEYFCSETGVVPTAIPVSGVFWKHQLLIVIGVPLGPTVVTLSHA